MQTMALDLTCISYEVLVFSPITLTTSFHKNDLNSQRETALLLYFGSHHSVSHHCASEHILSTWNEQQAMLGLIISQYLLLFSELLQISLFSFISAMLPIHTSLKKPVTFPYNSLFRNQSPQFNQDLLNYELLESRHCPARCASRILIKKIE